MTRFAFFAAALAALAATPALAKLKHTVLHDFGAGASDGIGPQDGLIADAGGNLYGTTFSGGDFGQGAVFALSPGGVERVIYSFHGAPDDGAQPGAALTLGRDGNLYGTTLQGGPANMGTVFRLVPNGANWQEEKLYSFCARANCADGAFAASPVTIAPQGNLFGTTEAGGSGAAQADNGVVYRLRPGKPGHLWNETVLHDFCNATSCVDGQTPQAARLLLRKNLLYGTASQSPQGGTLYSLNVGGSGFTTLLGGFGNGRTPLTGVVADKHGTLYGTTASGGSTQNGTAYSYDPATATFLQIYDFGVDSNVRTPNGGLVLTQNRQGVTLYGASQTGGGRNGGTVYKLTPAASAQNPWTEQNIYNFCQQAGCADGTNPSNATLLHLGTAFYGTTSSGGAHNAGTVYRMAP